jgi:hypothetical protein
LDGLISSNEIDIIKIDVEGAELGVVRGSENLVARSRPLVMFESGPPTEDELGHTKEAMWFWWEARNYGIFLPNRVAHDAPKSDGLIDAHF